MGCGSTLLKILLFVANVIFALAGLCVAGMGTAALVSLHEEAFNNVQADNLMLRVRPDHLAIAAIVVGVVAFVVAFFGCCGAVMESRSMLVIYSVLLIILMNLKTALATLLFFAKNQLIKTMNEEFKRLFDTNSPTFHDIETSFGCCGKTGAVSYTDSLRAVPATCCSENLCTTVNSRPGCLGPLGVADELVSACSVAVGALCIALVVLEFLLVVFGLCLANHVGNKYKGRY